MKLDPEDLVVSSFETAAEAIALPGTIGPYEPTPMTRCYHCPPRTIDCPIIITDPGTVVAW